MAPVLTRRWRSLTLILAAAIALLAVAVASADAYVYVAGPVTSHIRSPSTIERMTLDGLGVQPDFITGPRVESAKQLKMYGGRLYWLDSSANDCVLKSSALDGSDVQTLRWFAATPCGGGISMALAGGYLYWNDMDTASIGRMSLAPPYSAQPEFIRIPQGEADGLTTDGEWLYWYDDMRGTVGRARLDGSELDPALFMPVPPTHPGQAPGSVRLLGVEDGYLWWTSGRDGAFVGRAHPDGSNEDPNYLTGIAAYDGALTSHWLYYTGSSCGTGCVDLNGDVSRVALEPGATPQLLANLGEGVGSSIAVDSLGDSFPAIQIKKHRDGTATALVSTRDAGRISVRGKRIVHERAREVRSKLAGVPIRPKRGAKRQLRHHGSFRIIVRLVYRADRAIPQIQSRNVTLRLGRR